MDTVEEFFIYFEKAVNEFKSAAGNIDESEKIRYLLKTLKTFSNQDGGKWSASGGSPSRYKLSMSP